MSEIDDGDIYDMGQFEPTQRKCDGCGKEFSEADMDPCSGDMWYCWPCMDAYMKSAQDEAKK
jgi:hypothetical protein